MRFWLRLVAGISGFHCIGGQVSDGLKVRIQFRKRAHRKRAKFIQIMSLTERCLQSAGEGFENLFTGLLAMEKAVG